MPVFVRPAASGRLGRVHETVFPELLELLLDELLEEELVLEEELLEEELELDDELLEVELVLEDELLELPPGPPQAMIAAVNKAMEQPWRARFGLINVRFCTGVLPINYCR